MTEIKLKFIIEPIDSDHLDIKECSLKFIKKLGASFSESSFTPYYGVLTISACKITEDDLRVNVVDFFNSCRMNIIFVSVWSRDSYHYTLGFDDGFYDKSDYKENYYTFYVNGFDHGKKCKINNSFI